MELQEKLEIILGIRRTGETLVNFSKWLEDCDNIDLSDATNIEKLYDIFEKDYSNTFENGV